jgi:hypothetical protein
MRISLGYVSVLALLIPTSESFTGRRVLIQPKTRLLDLARLEDTYSLSASLAF